MPQPVPATRTAAVPADRVPEPPAERASERPAERVSERPSERAAGTRRIISSNAGDFSALGFDVITP